MMPLGNLFGVKLVKNPYMISGYEQVRKHHKRRINKKWAKKYGMKPIYDEVHIYAFDDALIMSPSMYDRLVNDIIHDS